MSSHSDDVDTDLFGGLDEKALAGADFTAEIIGELRRAFSSLQETTGLTQKKVADRLGTSKSSVHRWLYGDGNMTLRKLGEFIWAIGCEGNFKLLADRLQMDPSVDADEQLECTQPISRALAVDATCQSGWFRLESICGEEVRSVREQIDPSAPQMRFIGRNDAGTFRQCIMRTDNHKAVGYFKRLVIDPPGQTDHSVRNSDHIMVDGGRRLTIRNPASQRTAPIQNLPTSWEKAVVGNVA